jgi:hypothetical protein
MYTSVMLVALLGPGATPVVTKPPIQQVVYRAVPGQVVYYISSPAPTGVISPVVSSPTIVYTQPTTYVVSSTPTVTTTSASPVVYRTTPVIQSPGAVYSSPGVISAAPVSYAPFMGGGFAGGAMCRT